jgi:hypothetical protein
VQVATSIADHVYSCKHASYNNHKAGKVSITSLQVVAVLITLCLKMKIVRTCARRTPIEATRFSRVPSSPLPWSPSEAGARISDVVDPILFEILGRREHQVGDVPGLDEGQHMVGQPHPSVLHLQAVLPNLPFLLLFPPENPKPNIFLMASKLSTAGPWSHTWNSTEPYLGG